MSIDYGEIFCNAVDEIITSKLLGLQYDITKLCTIIDDTYSNQGKYIVSDGATRYEAFSTDINLRKGNNVLVLIPNGDYSMLKTITGRVVASDTTPFNYTSPMDTMIKITNNIFNNSIGDIGLLANDEGRSTIIGPIYSITETGNFAGFTRLGITANFKSWLNGLDVVEGIYGLKVLIYTDISNAPGSVKKDAVYELTFSSADMIGNPYLFESYFYQEKVFDISNINNIKLIDVYFYLNGLFKDGSGLSIPWQENNLDNIGLEPSKKPNNLFVNDVLIFLGYEAGAFTDETLMLYTSDLLSYHYTNENLQKNVSLRWIHKIDDKNFELLNSKNLDSEKFEVHWFRYNPGFLKINLYAGKDWEEVDPNDNDKFSYSFIPQLNRLKELIKVIGLIKEITGSETITDENKKETKKDIYSLVPYYSNLLIFENEEKVPDDITVEVSTALSIVCTDNSEGNYYIYNQNGKINNEGIGRGYTRYLKAMYQGAEISSDIGKLDWIKWYFPIESTMIIGTNSFYAENEGKVSDEVIKYKGVDYKVITRTAQKNNNTGKFELPSVELAYSIDNQWSFLNSNNTIRCLVSIDGIIYEAIEELRFGKGGTNGTEITFLIEFTDNNNAIIAEKDSSVSVRARLYDSTGARVGFTPEMADKIKWSWYNGNQDNRILLPQTLTGDSIVLTSNTNTVPPDNYFILLATYDNLTAYLPIPIKTKETSFIEGAREIIYNHLGIPNYYNDAYVLYYWDSEGKKYKEKENGKWELNYNGLAVFNTEEDSKDDTENSAEENSQNNELSKGYIPALKELSSRPGYFALSASPFYTFGYNDKVCVSCYTKSDNNEKTYLWSLPILIILSKYDFAMLNQWDGSLTLDEKNGTILSTMLGAGKKNLNNTFSGVLIGDIQKGSELNDTETLTGVYGIHEGVISYALKENGTATFGKTGHGLVLIDGNKSIILSASYSTGTTGTKIDLDDATIHIKWPGNETDDDGKNLNGEIKLSPTSPYFSINSSNNKKLIEIGTNSYLLSDNIEYDKTDTKKLTIGTKIDLGTGIINIKNNNNEILIGPLSPYLSITSENHPLINISDDGYYLLSKFYSSHLDGNIKNNETQDVYYYSEGLKYTNEDNITETFYYVSLDNEKKYIYNKKVTDSEGIISYLVYKKEDGKTIPISIYNIDTENDADFIEALKKYKEENPNSGEDETTINNKVKSTVLALRIKIFEEAIESVKIGQGMKIDLKNGHINGYDLYLKANNKDDPVVKNVLIDSSAKNYPFKIGSKFKVDWDGSLTCNKINSLSNDGTTNKAISINNNFYVTQGGSAGGSGVSFGGSFSGTGNFTGGISGSTGTFENLTTNFFTCNSSANFYSSLNVSSTFTAGGDSNKITCILPTECKDSLNIIGDFKIRGLNYSPQEITSTDGTIYAVIGRKKS